MDTQQTNPSGPFRVQRVSRRFVRLCTIIIALLVIGDLFFWLLLNGLPEGLRSALPFWLPMDLSALQRTLAALISLIPLTVALFGLITLRSLFHLYANAVFFTADNVRLLRRLGYAFLAWVLAGVLFTPLLTAVISFTNLTGYRTVVVEFGISDMAFLMIGGVVIVIGWVMDEGRKLNDEHSLTV